MPVERLSLHVTHETIGTVVIADSPCVCGHGFTAVGSSLLTVERVERLVTLRVCEACGRHR